jgi:hypothetical protein
MLNQIFLYIASVFLFAWGVAHVRGCALPGA